MYLRSKNVGYVSRKIIHPSFATTMHNGRARLGFDPTKPKGVSKRPFSVKISRNLSPRKIVAEDRPHRKISHIFVCSPGDGLKKSTSSKEETDRSVCYVGFDATSTMCGKKIVDAIEQSYADSDTSAYHRDLHMCWTTFLLYSAFEPDNLDEWIRNDDIETYRCDLYQMISDAFGIGDFSVERYKLGRWYVIPERELRVTHDMLKFNPGGITIAPLKTFYKSACF